MAKTFFFSSNYDVFMSKSHYNDGFQAKFKFTVSYPNYVTFFEIPLDWKKLSLPTS